MPPGRDSALRLGRPARWCGLSVHPRQKSPGTLASALSPLLAGQTRSALRPAQKRDGRRPTAMRAELAQGVKPALPPGVPPPALPPALLPLAFRAPPVTPPSRPGRLPLAWRAPPVTPSSRPALLPLAWRPALLPAMSSAGTPMASQQRVWKTLRAWARMAVRPDPRWSCPVPGCRSTFPSRGRCASRADAASRSGDNA